MACGVNIKRITNNLWNKHPGTLVILEHFANNDEEMELAAHGCLLWGKAHSEYNQSTMGYVGGQNDDFEYGVSHLERGWAFHNLVGFMESHDEERLMYNNLLYGNQTADYDIHDLNTSLKRMSQAAAFFFTVPGPKMIWQFGELGYDYSINFPSNTEESRTSPKPVKWDYYLDFYRRQLYLEYAALINLKTTYPSFRTNQYRLETWGTQKQIYIDDNDMKATIVGNFNIYNDNVYTGFQHNGWWYEYFTGDSILITGNTTISLNPGEYRVYTDTPLTKPTIQNTVNIEDINLANWEVVIYPNPVKDIVNVAINRCGKNPIKVTIVDINGKIIEQQTKPNNFKLNLGNLQKGTYHLIFEQDYQILSKKIIKN